MLTKKVIRHRKQPTVVKVVSLAPLNKLRMVVRVKSGIEVPSRPWHKFHRLSAGQAAYSDCKNQEMSKSKKSNTEVKTRWCKAELSLPSVIFSSKLSNIINLWFVLSESEHVVGLQS